jgi:predicted amidohydrolase YtcJ
VAREKPSAHPKSLVSLIQTTGKLSCRAPDPLPSVSLTKEQSSSPNTEKSSIHREPKDPFVSVVPDSFLGYIDRTLMLKIAAAAVCLLSAFSASAQTADLILVGGKIITVDAKDSIAQAIAIQNGKILAVGTNEEIRKLAIHTTRVIDLHGRTATPGLIDTHAHLARGGVDELYSVSLSDASTIAEVARRVQAAAANLKPGQWLTGAGWDEGKLTEHRYIFATDLDKAAPHNPVWLFHTTGHYGAANHEALRLAHIAAETKDPTAGTIDRDPQGQPTGVLKESAMDAVVQLIPPPTREQIEKGILRMVDTMHREGMTAVKDPDIDQPTWDAYRYLMEEKKLSVHVCVLWHGGTTLDSAHAALAHIEAVPRAPASLGDGNLLSCGAKLYMDGSGGARTAWVYQSWNKNVTGIDQGNFGYPLTNPEVYRQQVRLFEQAGVSVGTHAIGDHAIDWVVDTYAAVLEEKPTPGLRLSIIHANIPSDHAIDTMASLQKLFDAGYPEVEPGFTWWIGDTYAGNFGPERSQRLNPFLTFQSKGVIWTGGSDYAVTPLPARYGIWASVERETEKGVYGKHPFGTAESVDVHTALRSYTAWAARQLFLETRTGSIEPGKDADIAVWEKDLYTIPARELRNLKCEMTVYNGEVVYRADGTRASEKTR